MATKKSKHIKLDGDIIKTTRVIRRAEKRSEKQTLRLLLRSGKFEEVQG